MRSDSIKKYIVLRDSLLREKTSLETRLAQINQALTVDGTGAPKRRGKRGSKNRRRSRNRLSLKAAVTQVTKAKPLSKPEILAAIKKLGYRFTAANPINSLNTVLYSNRQFKNLGGKFSPA